MERSDGAAVVLAVGEANLLAEMLHALGQPLTVLGGFRLAQRMPEMVNGEWHEEMAEQVDRATAVYEAVRLLLEGGRGAVSLSEVVLAWRRRAAARRVELRVGKVAGWALEERVLDGLFGAGLRSCAAGQDLEVGVEVGWVVVKGGAELTRLPWELRVAMAVVGESVGDGGDVLAKGGPSETGVVYRLQPFHARVRVQPA